MVSAVMATKKNNKPHRNSRQPDKFIGSASKGSQIKEINR